MSLPKVIANFETSLASKISSSASSLTLVSATTKNGTTLPNGTYGLTIDEGTSSEEHMIVTLAGTAGTIVVRGLSVVDGLTNVAARQFEHRRGASVKMTDHPSLIRIIRRLDGDEAFDSVAWTGVTSISGLATPTSGETTKAANVAYVNSVVAAGAADATTSVKGISEEATDAELQAGTATGGTGARLYAGGASHTETPAANKVPVANSSGKLAAGWGGAASSLATLDGSSKVVQDPANATATPTASKIPIADGNGKLDAWITDGSLNVQAYVAGENINASTTPQAVYLKESDGRVYKTDSTSAGEAVFAFIGFVANAQNVTTGNSVNVITDGVVSGFSGLTVGGYYFGTNTAGTISTTAGTISYQFGRAVTASTLLIQKGKKYHSGVTTFTSTTTTVITCGFRPARVQIWGAAATASSYGGWDPNGGNSCVYNNTSGAAGNVSPSTSWQLDESTNTNRGSVTNITSTGFTLSNTRTNSPNTANIAWVAEA